VGERNSPASCATPAIASSSTPLAHASWLDQVELWLSILARKVLRRGHFTRLDDLQAKITAFITRLNHSLPNPFRWNYQGKPLAA
jgi:hypothetical protein